MKKYEGNMKNCVVNMKEYLKGSGTWKNSELSPSMYTLGLGRMSRIMHTLIVNVLFELESYINCTIVRFYAFHSL